MRISKRTRDFILRKVSTAISKSALNGSLQTLVFKEDKFKVRIEVEIRKPNEGWAIK